MYLRLIRCHLKEGTDTRKTAEIYRELLPAISVYEGFQGASLMVNHSTRDVVALLYWDSREHADEAGGALRPMLLTDTCELTDSPLDITGFQVIHHTMTGE